MNKSDLKRFNQFSTDEKYLKLLTISNPRTVLKKAKANGYDYKQIFLSPSKTKKYMIIAPSGKKVHFGSFEPPMEDFTHHRNELRRNNYLTRATSIKGNWKDNEYSPNNLSIKLLW